MVKKEEIIKLRIFIGITIILYIICIIISGIVTKDIEKVYYCSEMFSILFVICSIIIAVMQYKITSEEQVNTRKRELEIKEKEFMEIEKDRIQNAINLANYYKDNILDNIFIIEAVYRDTGIKAILENIKIEEMTEFDKHELDSVLTKKQQAQIEKIVNSNDFREALTKTSITMGFAKEAKHFSNILCKDGIVKKSVVIDDIDLFREYSNILNMLLNNTEYFAMNFTHKTADETVVYQSLHKTYLSLMQILYYDISQNNMSGEEKLYTNSIELFNIWKNRAKQQRTEGIELQRTTVSKGSELSYNKKS